MNWLVANPGQHRCRSSRCWCVPMGRILLLPRAASRRREEAKTGASSPNLLVLLRTMLSHPKPRGPKPCAGSSPSWAQCRGGGELCEEGRGFLGATSSAGGLSKTSCSAWVGDVPLSAPKPGGCPGKPPGLLLLWGQVPPEPHPHIQPWPSLSPGRTRCLSQPPQYPPKNFFRLC